MEHPVLPNDKNTGKENSDCNKRLLSTKHNKDIRTLGMNTS